MRGFDLHIQKSYFEFRTHLRVSLGYTQDKDILPSDPSYPESSKLLPFIAEEEQRNPEEDFLCLTRTQQDCLRSKNTQLGWYRRRPKPSFPFLFKNIKNLLQKSHWLQGEKYANPCSVSKKKPM